MTTLEKLAARVREEAKGEELSEIPCFICPAKESFSSACNDMHLCPVLDTDEVKSLTFVRWAVKLVAGGLKDELDKCAKAVKKAHDKYICVAGQAKIDAYDRAEKEAQSKVYEALLDLIDEASEKQAEEGSDGR